MLFNLLNIFEKIKSLILNKLPDKLYISLKYKVKLGHNINWCYPNRFNEKLQWLKLYDRKSEYTTYVDKYAVRDYIAKTIGEEYLISLLGVWDSPENINFDQLPNQIPELLKGILTHCKLVKLQRLLA